MKRTHHSRCFIFLIELDWLNFALDNDADFHWLNTEQLHGVIGVSSFFHNSLKWWSIYTKFLPVVAKKSTTSEYFNKMWQLIKYSLLVVT